MRCVSVFAVSLAFVVSGGSAVVYVLRALRLWPLSEAARAVGRRSPSADVVTAVHFVESYVERRMLWRAAGLGSR